MKFGFLIAFTIVTLSWGILEYEDAYTKAGELNNARKAIKWGNDYFLKVFITSVSIEEYCYSF